jgi:hypothetical protein
MTSSKREIIKVIIGTVVLVAAASWVNCHAENPVVQTSFTADPTPMVYNDTVYPRHPRPLPEILRQRRTVDEPRLVEI